MKVGLTYDLKEDWNFKGGDPKDANAELDKPETVDLIVDALVSGGHQVVRIGNVKSLLSCVDTLNVDIVFNICEGLSGRNRESQVPVILELYGIPYVGADALTLGVTLEKTLAKKMFIADGIPTPKFFVAHDVSDLNGFDAIEYPLIVKTIREGSSKGISESSRVNTLEELKARADYIIQTYRQPALIEEFISGTEFTVAVLGNDEPTAMPVVQTSINGIRELGDMIYTNDRLYDGSIEYLCPADISQEQTKLIQDLAVKAYKSVGCLDFGRVDFRVDRQGNPFVLEINPLPSFDKEDVFHLFPKLFEATFEETINLILNFALKRYNLIDHAFAQYFQREIVG